MKATPKNFFLYFTTMAALYVSAISLLTLWFHYIDALFPDQVYQNYDFYSAGIRFAIASLIVIFPLYVYFTRIVNQAVRREPELRELWIRKWLIYITLFVAGVTLAGDLIVLINTFLGGELTTRFVLKVLAVLVVIGSAFVYYWQDLKGYWDTRESLSKIIGGVTVLVVIGSIIGGFFIMGTPGTQRSLRLDDQRVSHLQTIQWQIVNYWQQKQVLPSTLGSLEDPISGFQVPVDPVTGIQYGYSIKSARTFQLCAEFALPNDRTSMSNSYAMPMGSMSDNWNHPAGEKCFDRTIDPDLYPPRKI